MSSRPKPSVKSMKGVFYEIVSYASKNGCPVTVHTDKSKIEGSNGYFSQDPKPHIQIALKGKTWGKAIELLIHEYCHYWQWKESFLERKDDEGNIIYSGILDGKDISPEQREKARVLIQLSEYDCEIRAASLFDKWNLESVFPPSEHIKSANTYNRHIAWSVGDKGIRGSGIFMPTYDTVAPQLWGNKEFAHFWDPNSPEGQQRILAPISEEHRKVFNKASKKSRS